MKEERLVDAVRLIKATYIKNFELRRVHYIDKTDLFLYLFHRWSIINEKESLPVQYKYSMNMVTGALDFYAMDMDGIQAKATWDMMRYGDDEDTFEYLDKSDKGAINRIVMSYLTHDYDTLLTKMCSPHSNIISPEMVEFLPFPFIINEEIMKDKLNVKEQ